MHFCANLWHGICHKPMQVAGVLKSNLIVHAKETEEVVVNSTKHSLEVVWFCLVVTIITSVAVAILIATTTVAFAVENSMDDDVTVRTSQNDSLAEKTFSGVVTDTHCGARHDKNLNKAPAECTKFCVRKGSTFSMVDGDKSYELQGDADQIGSFAGQRAMARGMLNGTSISVVSISSVQ